MRETTLSNCERNFILNAASEHKRLDGRKLDEFRDFYVHFGSDWGLCYTSLGETRVITQVSCEVQQPKITKPAEGLLHINVEISSMAAPNIEAGRGSEISNYLNVVLEKCLKDSRAVDLESLCLVAEEKVWALRVDVNILNHDGNLIQAASISSLAALAHFRRPDVTTDGEKITIHDVRERDPIPITLHHYPVCITYALLNNGESVLADPTAIEERIADANLIFGVNSYGEICRMHLGGNALVEPKLIMMYARKAAAKAREINEIIKDAMGKDANAKQSQQSHGLVECLHWDKLKSASDNRLKIQLDKFRLDRANRIKENGMDAEESGNSSPKPEIIDLGNNCAELVPVQRAKCDRVRQAEGDRESHELSKQVMVKKAEVIHNLEDFRVNFGEGGASQWEMSKCKRMDDEDDNSDSSKSENTVRVIDVEPKVIESIELSGDSEEEPVILESCDMENPNKTAVKDSTKGTSGRGGNSQQETKKNKKKRRKLQKRN